MLTRRFIRHLTWRLLAALGLAAFLLGGSGVLSFAADAVTQPSGISPASTFPQFRAAADGQRSGTLPGRGTVSGLPGALDLVGEECEGADDTEGSLLSGGLCPSGGPGRILAGLVDESLLLEGRQRFALAGCPPSLASQLFRTVTLLI